MRQESKSAILKDIEIDLKFLKSEGFLVLGRRMTANFYELGKTLFCKLKLKIYINTDRIQDNVIMRRLREILLR